MFLLPKGVPLFENLAATKLKLPEVLAKLGNSSFTGYASFIFKTSTVILVFEAGKLVSALLENQKGKQQTGFEVLTALTELLVTSTAGTLNIYKLSKDLTMCIHALLQGKALYKAQELKLIDINSLLAKVKTDRMNGCLRIYTDEHSALIFYKEGNPLGFFHNGSSEIETSSSESQKIAGMPGAKIDLFSTVSTENLMCINLLESTNIQNIWDTSVALHQSEIEKINRSREERDKKTTSLKLAELEEELKAVVEEYTGKVGRGVVDKALSDNGGNSCLTDESATANFLAGIERGAKLLTGGKNLKLLMGKLSTVITQANSEL